MPVNNQTDVTNIVSAINACPDCATLTAYATKQFDLWIKQQQDAIKAKASALAKKTVPTDLDGVINWIKTFTTEAATDYANAVTEMAEVIAAFATITAAITAKASAMSCGTIPIPPLPTEPPPAP
jgi:hypothetical protein